LEVKNRFAENPLVQFVQNLRNYVLHIKVPTMALVTSIVDMNNETCVHQIVLQKRDLLGSGFDWTKPASKYIYTVKGESVDLVQVVDTYRAEIESFYSWMGQKLRSIHKQEFEAVSKVKEVILRRVATEIPNLISQRLAYLERGLGTMFDVLGPFLTPDQHTELVDLHGDMHKWTEAALMKIGNYVPLPTELVEHINRLVASANPTG
jgi:hypothetical protein